MVRAPYSFLADTINVVAVDTDKELLETYRKFFDVCCFFNYTAVTKARDADKLLAGSNRVHVCLNGLSVTDMEQDEFYLLRTYARTTSFLMVSDTVDPRQGYTAGTYGARGFLRNPQDMILHTLLVTVLQAFTCNLINPDAVDDRPFLRRAIAALVKKNPQSVAEWCRELSVAESNLRRAWKEVLGFRPKHVRFLHSLYVEALEYYELVCRHDTGNTTAVLARPNYARQYAYYVENREALEEILHQKR